MFIFAGQSIAINSGTDSGRLPAQMLAPQTNVLFFNARAHYAPTSEVRWVIYQPPTGPGWSSDCGCQNPQGSFGPEITAANLISVDLYGGTPIAVYKYAVGATSLHTDWSPTVRASLYDDMRARFAEALLALPRETGFAGRAAGVFWTQGESDALDGPGVHFPISPPSGDIRRWRKRSLADCRLAVFALGDRIRRQRFGRRVASDRRWTVRHSWIFGIRPAAARGRHAVLPVRDSLKRQASQDRSRFFRVRRTVPVVATFSATWKSNMPTAAKSAPC